MSTLWLVGMMGSGKSTVARLIGAELGREVIDTDAVVADSTGRSVVDWLTTDPDGFRDAERRAVLTVAGHEVVVACGGGVVLDEGVVAAMRASGLVVWLDAAVGVLARRVGNGEGRPLLGGDPEAALARIMDERRACYQAAAHVTVAAQGDAAEVAEGVRSAWANWS